ncbi:MAG: hypothetical protein V9E98_15120 [Candidatus Nanopelagicales bacterium]
MAYRLAPLWNAGGSPRDPLDVVVTRRCEHRDCEAFVEPLLDPWTRRCVRARRRQPAATVTAAVYRPVTGDLRVSLPYAASNRNRLRDLIVEALGPGLDRALLDDAPPSLPDRGRCPGTRPRQRRGHHRAPHHRALPRRLP